MVKQWKENPPGPEQQTLDEMFDSGRIADYDTPQSVQASNAVFKDFTARNFAVHFRKTKARFGRFAQADRDGIEIPELGAMAPVASTSQAKSKSSTSLEVKSGTDVLFVNPPNLVWVYFDHFKKLDIVCIAISVISGARDVDFFLSDDNVTYTWPSGIYSPEELFRLQLKGVDDWTMDHPKIYAFNNRLLECDLSHKSLPQASMVLKLPMKVQRENGTWTKSGVKTNDNGLVVMLKFQAFQKKRVIEDADTSIKFE